MIPSFVITRTSKSFLHTALLRFAASLKTTKRTRTNPLQLKTSCLQILQSMLSSTPWICMLRILSKA
nr:hypothetical protein MANES_05G015300 [Ipomoea batatas]